MPYVDKKDTIDTLLHLPQAARTKQALLAVLVVGGEIVQAEMLLDGIKSLVEESKTKQWFLHDQNWWEWEGWLELMPFSDRPRVTLDALELLEPIRRAPWQLRRLLSALSFAPDPAADEILAMLPSRDARFLGEHDFLAAVDRRGSALSARLLLDLVCENAFGQPGGMDTWTLGRRLAGSMSRSSEFRADVYLRYETASPGLSKNILEHAIAEVADADGVLVLVRSYTQQGKPFDGNLHSAIRHVALGERPSANWAGANEVFSVPLADLRKKLFKKVNDGGAESSLATTSLTMIDALRDDYGPAESDPRHPDINSGCPWPLGVN